MARPLRIEYPGALYHITARGIDKKKIFSDDDDRNSFLDIIMKIVERYKCRLHSYCLMNNHYHLLLETPLGNLSKIMMQLNSIYSQYFNKKHNRVGHLFQGRYKSILVDKENYLLELSRYIVLNPVRAGIVKNPNEWKWSNYRFTSLESDRPEFLTIEWILSQFGDEKRMAAKKYEEFINSGRDAKFPQDGVFGQIILGGENFIKELKRKLNIKNNLRSKEIPRDQKLSFTPSLDEIFQKGMRSGEKRNDMICLAYYENNHSQKEIADYLNLHYTTISLIIKKYDKAKKTLKLKT